MPGPSAVPPLSTECTHPRTEGCGAPVPTGMEASAGLMQGMEGAVDDIELLLTRELDEVHRVAGHPDGELRVQLRVVHGMQQGLAVEDVDVDVVAALGEVAVQHAHQIRLPLAPGRPQRTWHDREG